MSKSFVTMEQHICMVCGQPYDTGALLLDRRLSNRFEQKTVTGSGICPEHETMHNDGFLALVEADPSKSTIGWDGKIAPEKAYRTGTIAHIRRTVARQIFNAPIPDDLPMVFVDPDVIAKLQGMVEAES